MTSLIGKSSLYDMLSCIIPGYLILYLLYKLLQLQFDIDELTLGILVFTLSYVVGLLYKALLEKKDFYKIRNIPSKIRLAYNKAEILDKQLLPLNNAEMLEQYYIAYFNAINGNSNSSIPTLEAQIAFLKGLPMIISIYIIYATYILLTQDEETIQIILFIIMSVFIICLIPLLMKNIQIRLHKLVWEDSYYATKSRKKIHRI